MAKKNVKIRYAHRSVWSGLKKVLAGWTLSVSRILWSVGQRGRYHADAIWGTEHCGPGIWAERGRADIDKEAGRRGEKYLQADGRGGHRAKGWEGVGAAKWEGVGRGFMRRTAPPPPASHGRGTAHFVSGPGRRGFSEESYQPNVQSPKPGFCLAHPK